MYDTQLLDPIETLEAEHLQLPQVECPVTHRFAPGVYLREIHMPAETFVIGHKHNTTHFNIIIQGSCLVSIDGKARTLKAPETFVSEAGVRKVLYTLEDMIWQTVHVNPDDEQDIPTLESRYIEKSKTYLDNEELLLETETLKGMLEGIEQ